ncbi:hypothetical protein [Aliikangiella sp. IMCC44359]|uniref:hypothetical protein n=1 Tax=Aliikangiella sp. IMCC44359 TaxID=3459125 RepID=UPI00403AAD5C
MSKYHKVIISVVVLLIGSTFYFYYPIYVGQNRFDEIQNKIELGMKREVVLAIAEDVGYLEHSVSQNISVKEDLFSYTNLLWPSLVIIEYGSNNIVKNVTLDQ